MAWGRISRNIDVFPQDAISVPTEVTGLDLLRQISTNVLQYEVRADTVSDLPPFDIHSNCYNLTFPAGAQNQIVNSAHLQTRNGGYRKMAHAPSISAMIYKLITALREERIGSMSTCESELFAWRDAAWISIVTSFAREGDMQAGTSLNSSQENSLEIDIHESSELGLLARSPSSVSCLALITYLYGLLRMHVDDGPPIAPVRSLLDVNSNYT
ncbi:hypothetical protein BKA82DRAFT_28382 [Pisolithus tinctorius]|uniref:Uncharacterized protein n=1 Tax=Pisolithus tinctorius Marx 270 TaxID=870435 RepID=A0A0C3JWV5_PISTI|nr:hypothetical protein BKA82DRAFT_28382 [Pisolithus tinctorius]KIO01872.1 hypothetical protein M404DRAFT_28382 [Pisolithus tinctorius Marx 270]